MKVPQTLQARAEQMVAWRRHLHAHPEIGFEEVETSAFVAERLAEFGLEVTRGLAETGVVGTLRCGHSDRAIGLRADMDALPMDEKNTFAHKSRNPGRMHGCGHDGHTTMLLGAASYLAETKGFDGTVHFIFQPAEEGLGGGDRMVKDGLFQRFPVDGVYGMHNWPGMDTGSFGALTGPVMASGDVFRFTVNGKGCHAAMPELGHDPFVAVSQLLAELYAVPSRRFSAFDALIISVTKVHGGSANNVIPDQVEIEGTVRTLRPEVRDAIGGIFSDIAAGIGRATGTTIESEYNYYYPVTVNHADETERAAAAAAAVVGSDNVTRTMNPSMGAEDFAFMLQARPGSYVWIGNGTDSASLHNPTYDFNDDVLPIGAAYWASLVQRELAA